METKQHVKREDLLEIIDINLDFLYQLDYTEITKLKEKDLKWLLYVFVCQDEKKREKIYEESKMIKRVDESLKRFTKEYDKILFYNKEEFQKRAAYEEGKNDEKKEIAKTMLKKYSVEEIMAITGLSKEEIKSLKEEE